METMLQVAREEYRDEDGTFKTKSAKESIIKKWSDELLVLDDQERKDATQHDADLAADEAGDKDSAKNKGKKKSVTNKGAKLTDAKSNASKTSTKQKQRDYPSSSDPNSSSSEYNDADSDETSSKSDDDSITMEDFGKMDETEKTEHFFKSQAKAKKVAKKTATLYAQLKNWKRDQEKKATKKSAEPRSNVVHQLKDIDIVNDGKAINLNHKIWDGLQKKMKTNHIPGTTKDNMASIDIRNNSIS